MDPLAPFAEQPNPPNQATPTESPAVGGPPHKNIFVCCDGTGNEFSAKVPSKKDKGGNSNVVKFYTALDLGLGQYAYYHPGVGTMGDPTKKGRVARWWSMIKGLAFGEGFQDNVLDAYRYLMQHYNRGDTVYILGFSRGAYTARALAGFLHGYGLLCRGNEGHILYAWNLYTAKLKKQRKEDDPKQTLKTDFAFRDTFSHQDFMIHFMGLWDTVSSVGWITTPLRLLHLAQNPSIRIGRHAVSLDERRCFYHDNLWGDPTNVQLPPILRDPQNPQALGPMQDMAQVWFPGVHSDVGGSYGQYCSGLSNESLKWMMVQAARAGAVFKRQRAQAVLGERVTMDPQERTEEIQNLYPRPESSDIHESLKWLWWVLEAFPHRYYNTDADKKEILRIPWGAWRRLPDGALLHPEARKKNADGTFTYNSPNLRRGTIQKIGVGLWTECYRYTAPPSLPAWLGDRLGLDRNPPPRFSKAVGAQLERWLDWRRNPIVVFVVKTLLMAGPVLVLRLFLLKVLPSMRRHWPGVESYLPNWIERPAAAVGRWWLHSACMQTLDAAATHGLAAIKHSAGLLGWGLVVAGCVVLFWSLFRLVKPRS